MPTSFRFQLIRFAALVGLVLARFPASPDALAQATSRLPVATVMPFDYSGVAPDQAIEVTRRVHAELLAQHKFALIDPVQAEEFIKEAAFRQDACAGITCAQRLGRKLGVEKVLMGKVTAHEPTRWSLSVELIDVATGRLERSAAYDHVGQFGDLLDTAPKRIALQLTEESTVPGSIAAPGSAEEASKNSTRDGGAFTSRSGWAFYSGYSNYSGTMKLEDGSSIAYAGGGIPSIGVEYQWKLSDPVTLGLFFQIGSGGPTGRLAKLYDSGGPLLNGLELRYWIDRWYVGGNVGLAQTCFFDIQKDEGKKRVKDLCFHGTAYGPAVGYQFANGLFIGGLLNYADLGADEHPEDVRVPRAKSATETDLWINVGYRWGQQ